MVSILTPVSSISLTLASVTGLLTLPVLERGLVAALIPDGRGTMLCVRRVCGI